MTSDDSALPGDAAPDDDLDGHTMDELSDYLDRGRTPYDASIENSAACRLALTGMTRLQELSWAGMTKQSRLDPHRDDAWISGLLDTIKAEVQSGRDVPLSHPDATLRLALTEAAVRGMIRRAGDTMDGVIMGRCQLDGDVTTPGAPVRVDVSASIRFGMGVDRVADELRERVASALRRHTELVVDGIDVTIDDIYLEDGHGHD
ncbi:Asp23/Gls24 family envelope stress response protein [Frondihabitans cladoniiphilus]|uniref:Asp23/Gls24 family envelope stress response protein n=1 Tax=Frondihabitans cladoniiphilus TaxID=715785 RepID=A0ABP8VLI6_9MICO